jgi:hypothetical protein
MTTVITSVVNARSPMRLIMFSMTTKGWEWFVTVGGRCPRSPAMGQTKQVDWIGKRNERPDTDGLVGLPIEDVRKAAASIPRIEIIRELGMTGSYTFDHRDERLTVLVDDGVVVAAGRF